MLRSWLRGTLAIALLVGVASQSRTASAVASAELYTVAAYRYGRFRARVQFPVGDGVVGSFFLWKNGSEMPNVFWNELDFEKFSANCALQFNAIFGLPRGDHPTIVNSATDGCAVFHTYGYEWTPDHIAWSVDDTELRRDTGVTAQAYADQAAQGMQIRFNLWPGTPAFGGTFSESILPVHQFVSWVEYSSFTPGAGDAGGDFTLVWRESFENGIPVDWAEGNWVSAASLSTHSVANVTAVAGVAILSLTADNATGFAGLPPVDPGDLPSARGSSDGGLPTGPDAGPSAPDAGAPDVSAADGIGGSSNDAQNTATGDSAPTDVANAGPEAEAGAPSEAAPDRADGGVTSIADAAGNDSTDATSISLADSSDGESPDATATGADAAASPTDSADASAPPDVSPSTDADFPDLSEAAVDSSAGSPIDAAATIDSATAGERRPSDQNGCGCRLSVAARPASEEHFLAVAFLAFAAATWSRRRRRRRTTAALPPLLTLVGCASGQTVAGRVEPPEAVRVDATVVVGASSPADRAESLLAQMTLDEKLAYIGGDRDFYIRPVVRLGIPEIKMSDGPAGCRNWGPNTAFPAAISLAASFDEALAERVGRRIGHDCRARGVHILLAPGMNIQRAPLNGRNFEYLGEDPLLAGTIASAFIRGVQSEGVLCTAKHFAGNNQEWDRNHISSEIDERSLREIYFPAFERSVREGRVAAVMTAYNLLNGTFCSHHPWLLQQVLKQEWGFSGLVMSDWGAVHDGLAAAKAGLDLEMPRGVHMNEATLSPLLAEKKLDLAIIDDKVRRILRAIVGAGFLDGPQKRDDIPLDDPKSRADALDAARRGLVLLKNAGPILPLDLAQTKRIAVIGPNADPAVVGGSGSAFVTALHPTSLLDGLRQVATGVNVLHHPGLGQSSEMGALGKPCFTGPVEEEVFAGRELQGASIAKRSVDRINLTLPDDHAARGLPLENFSVRWTGTVSAPKKGNYRIMTKADDGVRVLFDGKTIIDDWHDHAPKLDEAKLDLAGGKHRVVVEYYQAGGGAVAQFAFARTAERTTFEGEKEVSSLARGADAVVVAVGFGQSSETNSWRTAFPPYWPPDWARVAGLVESEDSDRPFELAPAQVETIKLVAAVNPRTIVIINAGGPVDVQSFVGRVPALLYAWYPGQEGGRAIADILFGNVSPSGKLPVTFGKRYADYPSAASYQVKLDHKTPYAEGVFVGYRGFDRDRIEPAFPFGHGIGYTTFEYTNLAATPNPDGGATVTFTIANSGKRGGEEVAQVYVGPPTPKVPRPPKELKGFARVSLAPGERQEVRLALEPRAFAYWDDAGKQWAVDPGSFEISVGASSRDIRLTAKVDVPRQTLRP